MYNEETDRYNYISINCFLIPIISSIYYECNLFLIQCSLLFVTGLTYHIFLRKIKKLTPALRCLRCLDMIVVHSVTSYIFYYSLYLNVYSLISTFCLTGLVTFYYVYNEQFSHSYIHILGSTAILSAIQSCNINLETCHMC